MLEELSIPARLGKKDSCRWAVVRCHLGRVAVRQIGHSPAALGLEMDLRKEAGAALSALSRHP
jgi:hypothetical protein